MPRPPEKTFAYGEVPYEERPFVCQGCGEIVRWDTEPQLVGHKSEEPDARAKFEEYRGEPLADEINFKPAQNRPGGLVHQHIGGLINKEGKEYTQWVGGSTCEQCGQGYKDQIAAIIARRKALGGLLRPGQEAQAEPIETLKQVATTEADAAAFFGVKLKKQEDKEGS